MSSKYESLERELEVLKREIQALKAQLNQELSQRASADEVLSSRIGMLSASNS
ncbi:hypothetical protein [Pseudomonas protegens]|uniref:hypothetical protein n=1 Tax=Pseudomonas protegens TaxID=380021 RepID=UPI001E6468B2|nr:hypothetical protein [Pseudomonas protegens]MCD9572266.1 hypothetical protein [Pseudomonas protegens]